MWVSIMNLKKNCFHQDNNQLFNLGWSVSFDGISFASVDDVFETASGAS